MNTATPHPVPGWHGKLPSLGDFASRRLDASFVEVWDAWLAAGLLALRQAQPEAWLQAYLASPSWRFVLQPGALPGPAGAQAWAGVLMPSVDRVGRYFPLTLAQPLGEGPASAVQMQALWHWLGRLDELAADALQDDWGVDRLEEELARMAQPDLAPALGSGPSPVATSDTFAEWPLPAGADAATLLAQEAQTLWGQRARGQAHWYASTDLVSGRLLVSLGLPPPACLDALLGATI